MHMDNFILNAILAAVMVSIAAGTMGPFVVLKRYALMSDAMSHTALLGAVLGLFFGGSSIVLSLIVCIGAAISVEYMRSKRLPTDTLLATIISSSLAASIAILSLVHLGGASMIGFLFGSVATVNDIDLIVLTLVCFTVIMTIYFHYEEFCNVLFDEECAQVSGINVQKINLIMTILLACLICVSIHIVGALMISALLVISALSALRFKITLGKAIHLSIVFAVISSMSGLLLSYHYAIPAGTAIVLSLVVFFILSSIVTKIVHK
jgi:zinc transport system permease protein